MVHFSLKKVGQTPQCDYNHTDELGLFLSNRVNSGFNFLLLFFLHIQFYKTNTYACIKGEGKGMFS